jgi:PAS domain S-box-containing protein
MPSDAIPRDRTLLLAYAVVNCRQSIDSSVCPVSFPGDQILVRMMQQRMYQLFPLPTSANQPGGSLCGRWCVDSTTDNLDQAELHKRAALLDLANDAIFVTELDGTITHWNRGAERLYDWTAQEALGKNEAQLLRAEFPLAHDQLIEAFLQNGHWEGEVTRYRRSGEPLIVSSRWSLLRDNNGVPVARMVINTDLTATKLAFEELRRAEAEAQARASELTAIFDAMPGATLIAHDPQCRTITSNIGARELLRWPHQINSSNVAPADERQNSFRAMRDGCDLSLSELPLQLAASTGQSVSNVEMTIAFADGTSRDILGNAVPLFDSSGKVRGSVAAFIDITERNRALSTLREQEERFRALAESLPQLIWTADPNGQKTYCNQPYFDYAGIDSLAEMDSSWQEIVHPDDRESAMSAWKSSIATGEPYLKEYRLRRKDGVFRHYLARAVPLRDECGEIEQWLGSITDIHDQKIGEEVLRRTEKLAATGRLAASIAHEINNPLNAAGNVLYLALQDPNLTDATRKYLKLAEHELTRVSNVTTQTLRFHRQSSNPAPADLCEIMNSALAMFAARFDDCSISVERECSVRQKLYCYDGELRQVFANLLSNALDAMRQGGRIRIRVKLARTWLSTRNAGIKVIIADTGCGIPDNLKRQIFEPFVSTKEATSTGLGLWVTEGIMRNHHGRIRLRSCTDAKRHGTVFALFFPFVGVAE